MFQENHSFGFSRKEWDGTKRVDVGTGRGTGALCVWPACCLFFTSTRFCLFLHWLCETEAEIGGDFMTLQNLLLLYLIFNKKQAPLSFCNGSHPFLCFNPSKSFSKWLHTQLRFDRASCLCCNFCGCCHLLLQIQEKPPVLHTLESCKHLCPLFFFKTSVFFSSEGHKYNLSCLPSCPVYCIRNQH